MVLWITTAYLIAVGDASTAMGFSSSVAAIILATHFKIQGTDNIRLKEPKLKAGRVSPI